LALQLLVYIEAQYLEYRLYQPVFPDGTRVPFTKYFDLTTRSMSFQGKHDKGPGQPLGAWGYLFRLLEAGGFALGGLIPSMVLLTKPFCDTCQVYMKTKSQGFLPAGVIPRKIKKNDVEGQKAYEEEARTAFENGVAQLQAALNHAAQADARSFAELMAQYKPQQKEIQKQTARIDLQLNYCPHCHSGNVRAICVSGQGENISQQDLQIQQVDPNFVEQCTMATT
jgi:hypothetical protein